MHCYKYEKKQMVGKSALPITPKGKHSACIIKNAFDISPINDENGGIVRTTKAIALSCLSLGE